MGTVQMRYDDTPGADGAIYGSVPFGQLKLIKSILRSNARMKPDAIAKALQRAGIDVDEIMKAGADIGYPTQAQEVTGAAFSPLVPQSIDPQWDAETFDDTDLVLTNLIPEQPVGNTVHEHVKILDYGDGDIEAFASEGEITEVEQSVINKDLVQVKFIMVVRSITEQAVQAMILSGPGGGSAVSRSGLMHETQMGVNSLKRKYEHALFRADAAVHATQFNGIRAQIVADGVVNTNIFDLRGLAPTPGYLLEKVAGLCEDPTFSKIDTILLPPRVIAVIMQQVMAAGRYMMDGRATLYINPTTGQLAMTSPTGTEIILKAAPLMNPRAKPKAGASGSPGTSPAFVATYPKAVNHASSLFDATWAADYIYKIKFHFKKGTSIVVTTSAITVGAAQSAAFDFDSLAAQSDATNPLRWIALYRSTPNGTADTAELIGYYAVNTSGGSGGTIIYDHNATIPGTSDVYGLEVKRRSMYMANFMGTARFPLPRDGMTQRFAIAKFTSPFVTHPARQLLVKNAATTL